MKAEAPLLTALYAELEEKPSDRVTLLALADWYEEHASPQAGEAVRWLATHEKTPYRYRHEEELTVHFNEWKNGWYWWATDTEGHDWGHPESCRLPHQMWNRMKHTFDYNPLVFREYPTVRAAIEAFVWGWTRKRAWYRRKKEE